MKNGKGLLLMAFAAGAVAGALAGYFLNTEQGRKLWAEWKEKAGKAKDSVLNELEELEKLLRDTSEQNKTT